MKPNTIICADLDQFVAVIAGLVRAGIHYAADADRLTITTTGGF
jgi:hypothetical protein